MAYTVRHRTRDSICRNVSQGLCDFGIKSIFIEEFDAIVDRVLLARESFFIALSAMEWCSDLTELTWSGA